jgi:hypothetical protein
MSDYMFQNRYLALLASLASSARFPLRYRSFALCLAILFSLAVTIGLGRNALCIVLGLLSFRDVGYPDSANLLQAAETMASLHIYLPLDRPPYLVTPYGPLTYLLFALTHGFAELLGVDTAVASRCAVLLAFLCCLLVVHRLIRAAGTSQPVALICLALLLSSPAFAHWTTQIRGDFPAAALSLLSVLAVKRGGARAVLIAGLFAAGAILTKQSFVSAAIAIAAWLLLRRRPSECARFLGVVLACAGAGYGLLLWREPLMAAHWSAMGHFPPDPRGALLIGLWAASQPIMVAGIGGLLLAAVARQSLPALFVLYFLTATVIEALSAIQIGANINTYWESMFAATLVASAVFRDWPGLLQYSLPTRRLASFLAVFLAISQPLLLLFYVPSIRGDIHAIAHYQTDRAQWSALAELIAGQRVLSTRPDIAIMSSVPELPEPFTNSVLEPLGAWSSAPVVGDIERQRYRMILVDRRTWEGQPVFRGVKFWPGALREAVLRNYRPVCDIFELHVLLPDTDDTPLRTKLMAIGCTDSGQ